MKSTTLLGSLAVAGSAMAQPHMAHFARHQHQNKRDLIWVTEVAYETKVIDVTTTVWVTEGQEAPSAAPANPNNAAASPDTPNSVKTSSSAVVVVPTTTSAVVQQPAAAPPKTTLATSSSSAIPAVFIPQSSSSSSSSVVVVPTTSTKATSTTAAAPPATSTAAPPSSGGGGGISIDIDTSLLHSGSQCVGSDCSGDLTFYEAGLGACGYNTDGNDVYGIALPVGFMGDLSNSNPYCNMTLSITYEGTTIPCTVIDKCMACSPGDLDLTNAAFAALGIPYDKGRVIGSWHFTGGQTTNVFSTTNH